nr:basic proline-rich protein-like [Aegilops tauschii subsp. strangulata]
MDRSWEKDNPLTKIAPGRRGEESKADTGRLRASRRRNKLVAAATNLPPREPLTKKPMLEKTNRRRGMAQTSAMSHHHAETTHIHTKTPRASPESPAGGHGLDRSRSGRQPPPPAAAAGAVVVHEHRHDPTKPQPAPAPPDAHTTAKPDWIWTGPPPPSTHLHSQHGHEPQPTPRSPPCRGPAASAARPPK